MLKPRLHSKESCKHSKESCSYIQEYTDGVPARPGALQISMEAEDLTREQYRVEIDRITESLSAVHSTIAHQSEATKVAQEERDALDVPLAEVAPVVQEACAACDGLTRVHINEVKGLKAPPTLVRKTIEMVYLLFHADALSRRTMPVIPKIEWKDDCCRMLNKRDFIQQVMRYGVSPASTGIDTAVNIPAAHPLASFPQILDFMRQTYMDERGSTASCSSVAGVDTVDTDGVKPQRRLSRRQSKQHNNVSSPTSVATRIPGLSLQGVGLARTAIAMFESRREEKQLTVRAHFMCMHAKMNTDYAITG